MANENPQLVDDNGSPVSDSTLFGNVDGRSNTMGSFKDFVAPNVDNKADKVVGATAGDLAGLDANGNLTDTGISTDIVPNQASSSNPLADKGFVNSSVATNTANFLGTYDYEADLGFPEPTSSTDVSNDAIATALDTLTYSTEPTNNDYVFVQIDYSVTTPADEFRRFKFNGTNWAYEFTLNNSSFTAAQWAAINSAITDGLVSKLDALPTATALAQTLAFKAPLESPAFTGTPTAPTPTSGDNSTKVATTAFVQNTGADKLDSTSAAPAFSTSSTYAVDEHVTYNGKLYRCTTAVTTAGAWDASKWTADTMTDPDAVLDITSQNQLRVVAKDGTLLWAQGYDLASTSSATLACDATNLFVFAATSVSAFSDAATYAVDDRVTYGGKMYKCTTAVETAGAWTGSANWTEDPDVQAFTLPTAATGKVGDFGLDIDNTANAATSMSASLTGLDSAFSVVVPKGENLADMLTFEPGEMAEMYFTLTAFRVNNLPTWSVAKRVVENGGAMV